MVSKAIHIISGVNDLGERERLNFSIFENESYETWKRLYEQCLDRGLTGLKLVISDAHKGEVRAIKETFYNGPLCQYTISV